MLMVKFLTKGLVECPIVLNEMNDSKFHKDPRRESRRERLKGYGIKMVATKEFKAKIDRTPHRKAASGEARVASSLKRASIFVKPPTEAGLRQFASDERQLIRKRLSEPFESVFNPAFRRADAEQKLVKPLPIRADKIAPQGMVTEEAVAKAVANPLRITAEQERELFLRYNYCRFRIMELARPLHEKRLTGESARELLHWESEAAATRELIAQANLGLVPAMLKRSRMINADIGDLIGEGYLALLRSIDRFDCARGFKFSTYACRAILSSFSRVMYVTARDRRHAPAVFDPKLEKVDVIERRRTDMEDDALEELRSVIAANAANLTPIEWQILHQRFGFESREKQEDAIVGRVTLAEIAGPLGLTRERVRQIQNAALMKLRGQLEERLPQN